MKYLLTFSPAELQSPSVTSYGQESANGVGIAAGRGNDDSVVENIDRLERIQEKLTQMRQPPSTGTRLLTSFSRRSLILLQ